MPVAVEQRNRTLTRGEHQRAFGQGHRYQPSRSEVPTPGRWIRSGRHPGRERQITRTVDWPTYPLRTPSGGGPAPTPYRSKSPAKGSRKWKEGLTNQGPLQKPGWRQRSAHASWVYPRAIACPPQRSQRLPPPERTLKGGGIRHRCASLRHRPSKTGVAPSRLQAQAFHRSRSGLLPFGWPWG